jgi:oligopeptide transport system permease protein
MSTTTISVSSHHEESGTSLTADAIRRLKQNKMAMFGLCVLIFMIVIALLTPWIAPYSYDGQLLELGATPPSAAHWLGTDTLGRDQLTRIMYGSRISLMVGFIATAVALTIGVLWGAIAGFVGGRVDAVMMRIVDALYALPFTIFIILLTVIFGSSMLLLFLAIGAVEWLTMARIVRGQVLTIKRQEFVEAAISMGLSPWRIISRHLIPNVLGPVIVYTTLTIPSVILLESFLSFLGLGIQPPASSWGSLISGGVETMEEYPWLLFFPGLVLTITLFSLNFLGDGLRDALDPRASKD